MNSDPRLRSLMVRWQQQREQGTVLTPRELCKDCPELEQPFRQLLLAEPIDSRDAPPDIQETCDASLSTFPENPRTPGESVSPQLGELGDFQLLEVIGEGGMGTVYLAEDKKLKRKVAVKRMKPETAKIPVARARFLREAQAAATLDHEHIAPIHFVGEAGDAPYLVMPLLRGETLDARLKRGTPLPIAEVVRIGQEMAVGLQAAHDRGVTHRDIKPSNIWLEPIASLHENEPTADRVKILDFGLARLAEDNVQLTQSGHFAGTPAYMSPEQAKAEPTDHRCDLFSLGAVLYLMATGKLPFAGDTVTAVLLAVVTETPTDPRQLNPNIPAPLASLILKLLAKDPRQRPESAREVAKSLAALREPAPRPATQPAIQLPTPRRPFPIATGWLAAALTLLLAAAIIIRIRTPDGKETTVVAPDQSRVEITPNGTATVTLPEKEKPLVEPKPDAQPTPTTPIPTPATASTVTSNPPPPPASSSAPKTIPTPSPPQTQEVLPAHELNYVFPATPRSPLDNLDASHIPVAERFPWQPKELVAVIGEHKGHFWSAINDISWRSDGKQIAIATHLGVKMLDPETFEVSDFTSTLVRIRNVQFSVVDKILTIHGSNGGTSQNEIWDLSESQPKRLAFGTDDYYAISRSRVIRVTTGNLAVIDFTTQTPTTLPNTIRIDGKPHISFAIAPNATAIAIMPNPISSRQTINGSLFLTALIDENGATLQSKAPAGTNVKYKNGWFTSVPGVMQFENRDGVDIWNVTESVAVLERASAPYRKGAINNVTADTILRLRKEAVTDIQLINVHADQNDLVDTATIPSEIIAQLRLKPLIYALHKSQLALVDENAIRAFRIENGKLKERGEFREPPVRENRPFQLTPEMSQLALLEFDSRLRFFGLSGKSPIEQERISIKKGTVLTINAEDFSFVNNGRDVIVRHALSVDRLDIQAAPELATQITPVTGRWFSISGDRKRLASSYNGVIQIRDLGNPVQIVRELKDSPSAAYPQMSFDGQSLIGIANGQFLFWNIADYNPQKIHTAVTTFSTIASSFAISPTRSQGIAGDRKIIQFFNFDRKGVETGMVIDLTRLRMEKPYFEGTLKDKFSYSPDGKCVSVCGDTCVRVFDSTTGALLREWEFPGFVYGAKFAADGRHLVTANANGTVYILRLAEAQK